MWLWQLIELFSRLLLPSLCSFDAVPEYRRKQLFAEYVSILDDAGLLAGEADRAAAVAAAGGASGGQLAELAEGEAEGANQDQLEFLRREQARLKDEYARWVRWRWWC